MTRHTVLDAVAAAERHGPFFVVTVGSPLPGAGWRRADELGSPQAIAEQAAAMRASLGEVEDRVVASTFFLGWAARLVAPVLAGWQHTGGVLELPATATYRHGATGDVYCADPVLHPVPDGRVATAAELVSATVLEGSLLPLVDALAGRVAEGVLLGNVSSAVFGALRVLGDGAEDAVALGLRLLDSPALASTAEVLSARPPVAIRRRSCCLFYRIPGGGLCGDCALTPPPR